MARRARNVARIGQFRRLAKSAGFRRNPQKHAGTGAIRQEKTPTENGWGFIIDGGAAPRTKLLLKVRNRSAAGCCEPLRTPSKSLPDCRPASRFSSHAGRREQASNPSAFQCQFKSANPESNPRPHGGSNGGLGSCVIVGSGVGEPANRQGTALLNQSIDLLNHGIASKTVSGVRLELARRRWQ